MIRAVADTHALIWYVWADPRMSLSGRKIIDDAAQAGEKIAISSISLIEIIYLIEKHRVDPATLPRILSLLDLDKLFLEVVVDRGIVDALATIPRDQVPDMPDRIIAATAVHLGVPLISRDRKIQSSQVLTIW